MTTTAEVYRDATFTQGTFDDLELAERFLGALLDHERSHGWDAEHEERLRRALAAVEDVRTRWANNEATETTFDD